VAETIMFAGHDPYLVALSVVIAILGGYTGFGLAARIRGTPDVSHRVLLAGAAGFLAVGIWTMHFVGMLAAPLPSGTVYLVLPTIVSFLICALVVGVSLFFVSVGEPSLLRVVSSAVLLGLGIASMHYVGMHGLSGGFAMEHEGAMVALSVLIAIAAAYGGLRAFLARQGGVQLILSATAFGIAVSGMHYTAMAGMRLVPASEGAHHHIEGLAASPQILSLVVALLCFVIAAGFLLSLVPEPRRKAAADIAIPPVQTPGLQADALPAGELPAPPGSRLRPTPLGGIGQPTPTIPRSMTAPASGCVRGRSRRPKPSSTPGCSSGCTAATSWRSRTSPSYARKATARWSGSMARRRIGCRSAVPRSPRSRRDWASPGAMRSVSK
jgi:diguanylate cyclase